MELAYANDFPSAVFDLLANVRVLFFDKSFIPMLEKEMKQGDKVWWFDARTQTIVSGEVIEVDERAGNVYTHDKTLWINREGFPSREALCEHYREIFE